MADPIYKWKAKAIAADIEGLYAVDQVPTFSANAILSVEGSITPLQSEEIVLNVDNGWIGTKEKELVARRVACEFKVPVAGAGGAGTVPAWGPLHRGCGLAQTINVGVDVRYTRIISGEESLSMYFVDGGVKHVLLGSRGDVSLVYGSNNYLFWMYKFLGLYVTPTALALPSPDLSGFIKPVHVSNDNTSFSVHGYAGVLDGLEWGLNNDVKHSDRPGDESIRIVDSAPGGSVTIFEPPIGTQDFYSIAENRTKGAVNFQQGQTAGNIVQINGANVELGAPAKVNIDGITGLKMNTGYIKVGATPDVEIIVK